MISEQAVIHKSAKIGKNTEVGPFSVIGEDVVIGDNCQIGPHVVIKGPCKIGDGNKFFQFCSIGEVSQDKKFKGEVTTCEIGNNNSFREGCTIHRGTKDGGGVTKIGNDNLFMVNTHVAHDCIIGDHVIFSNCASAAGHVIVEDYACLGGMVGVHQFCKIGAHSFIAGGSIVFKDIMPYVTVAGYPAKVSGLNTEGLKRRDFSTDAISNIKKAYRLIFREGNTVAVAIEKLQPLISSCKQIELFANFLKSSERGIAR